MRRGQVPHPARFARRREALTTVRICLALCLPAGVGWAAPPAAPEVVESTTDVEYTVQFTLKPPARWPNGGELRLLFDQRPAGDGHALVIDARRCWLARTVQGKLTPLGRGGALPAAAGPLRGVLKRRLSRMTALLDGGVVATACDSAFHQGAVAWTATHGALRFDDLAVQPVGAVEFTDDFVRESGFSGGWQTLVGGWEPQGPVSKSPRPDLSANPFSLRATCPSSAGLALTAAGEWFWDDYRVTTAAKAGGPGALGVAAHVQDAANFLLFRWTATGDLADGWPVGRKQLLRVRDGRWTVLAESPGGFRADRWYALSLSVCDGSIAAGVDGKMVLRASDASFGQGRVGLFAQDMKSAYFDDVTAFSTRDFTESFGGQDLPWWANDSGTWTCKLGHLYCSAKGAAPAVALVGDSDWSHYRLAADVKPKGSAAVGLVACRTDDGAGYVFRWEKSGRQALVLQRSGGPMVLAEGRMPRDGSRFYRLALTAADGRVAAEVDDRTVLEVASLDPLAGRAGLLAEDPSEACFDNVSVTFAPRRPPEFRVTAQFTREATMENWVDPSHQWRRADGATLWYDMPLFGDFALWLPPVDLSTAKGQLDLYLGSETKTGAAAHVMVKAEGGALTGHALIGGKTVAEGQMKAEASARLRVARAGSCVSVWQGERPLLSARDDGFQARCLGLQAQGLPLDVTDTALSSPHLVDATFSGAPTDWSPGFGVWEVTDRWPCAPGWSWFGGSGHQSPLLWSKDTFGGDQVLEFWAGLRMDMDHEPGYSRPSDLDATVCGDGEKLCSGYSFILAGAGNTKSMIMRGNQVVAENAAVRFENPVSMNFAFHRHWFDLRIEKTGGHLRYSVDGKLVAEWTDPDPLPGGKVAFWSWNNGLLIARARAAAERVTR